MEPGGRALRTRRLTVVPSRQRSSGAGTDPLTVIAGRVAPVQFIGVSPMVRSNAVPERTLGTPSAWTPPLERGQRPKAPTATPAARPCTTGGPGGGANPPAQPH